MQKQLETPLLAQERTVVVGVRIDEARGEHLAFRVDFAAAGTLLNWVSSHCAQGRQVQFIDVHRLIGAFFNVIGISELARISVRTD